MVVEIKQIQNLKTNAMQWTAVTSRGSGATGKKVGVNNSTLDVKEAYATHIDTFLSGKRHTKTRKNKERRIVSKNAWKATLLACYTARRWKPIKGK